MSFDEGNKQDVVKQISDFGAANSSPEGVQGRL